MKLWRVKDEKIRKVVRQKIDETATGCESWDDWSHNLLRAATRVYGRSRGGQRKVTWWWNDVKKIIKDKRLRYKK